MNNSPPAQDTSDDIKPKDTPNVPQINSTKTLKKLTLKELEKINLECIKGVHREGAD